MTAILQQQTFLASHWGAATILNGTATVDEQFGFAVVLTGTLVQGDTVTLVELNSSHTSMTLTCTGLGSNEGFVLVDGSGNNYLFSDTALSIGSQQTATISGLPDFVPCFCRGTRILTDGGEVAVEDLRIGNQVRTISGSTRPIEWIGRRSLDCRRHAAPDRVKPIRIAPHAFGENRPKRVLLLSPGHSVFVEDVLIPIMFPAVSGAARHANRCRCRHLLPPGTRAPRRGSGRGTAGRNLS